MTECCFQKIADCGGRDADLLPPGFESKYIRFLNLNLSGVLDQHDALEVGNEFPHNTSDICFTSSMEDGRGLERMAAQRILASMSANPTPCSASKVQLLTKPSFADLRGAKFFRCVRLVGAVGIEHDPKIISPVIIWRCNRPPNPIADSAD
jgi:hypothetical protein